MGTNIIDESGCVNMVVRVILKKNDSFLMVCEAKKEVYGKWGFPSGKVHLGESLIEAVKREAKEETGLEIEVTDLLNVIYDLWTYGREGVNIEVNFWGEITNEAAGPIADDILALEWKTTQELEKLLLEGKLRNNTIETCARDAIGGKKYPLSILSSPSSVRV